MGNKERSERLRALSPLEAMQAWLDGDFGLEEEPALIDAIRKDSRIKLSDEEITDTVSDALLDGVEARTVLDRLAGSA